MTKKEFLTELRNNLSGLPKEEIDDRVNFYSEMIDDRMDEGKTEEQAVADIGTTDEAVRTIASQTKMSTLVKEKMRPKRKITGFEICMLVLGFPLWFPLLVTFITLLGVGYILLWTLAIVSYSVEFGLLAGFGGGIVGSIASVIEGNMNLMTIGGTIMCLAAACFFAFACVGATKVNVKLTQNILTGIKQKIIKGRN